MGFRLCAGLAAVVILSGCGGGSGQSMTSKTTDAIFAEAGLPPANASSWRKAAEEHETRDGGADVYVLRAERPVAPLRDSVQVPADTVVKTIAVHVKAAEVGQPTAAMGDSGTWKNDQGSWTAAQVVTNSGAWLWLQRIPAAGKK